MINLSHYFARKQQLGQPLRVLVAEDNSINRMVIGRILERAGYHHQLVKNGQQALDALEQASFDLVIVDMHMPEVGGLDAYRMYRFAHASDDNPIPFIMLTANATQEARNACEEVGIEYFLTKPISSSKLLDTLARAAAGRPTRTGEAVQSGALQPVESAARIIDHNILGEVTKEYADILRQADHIYIEELYRHDLYDEVSQAFAVFLPVKSVGVVGDARRYEYVVTLRAVTTVDFMTAHFAHLPYDFLETVSRRIINEVPDISRVAYDISGKPPATIEWE